LRVLYSHRIQSHDGASVHIEEFARALRNAGHEVLVVGPGLYARADFGGGSRLLSVFRRLVPQALLEIAELLYNIPAVLRLQRAYRSFTPDFVYERYNLFYLAGLLLRWWYRIPLYLEVNSPVAEERSRYGGLALRWFARIAERWVWLSANRIFVVTEVLKGLIISAGVPADRITVVPNGIDRESFVGKSYRAGSHGSVTIGFIGFVRDWHGVDAVIAGLAENRSGPTIRLIIAGDGPARPALEQQAAELGVQGKVQFIGLLSRKAIPGLICEFDIALQPHVVAYASPLKIFEYMACGCAIVAPDQSNIREILTNGQTAMLFEPADSNALWDAIRRLAADPPLRERLGRAARQALETRDYTWQGNATRVMTIAAGDCGVSETARTLLGRPAPP
jgi:glycosyltransferase involved in cell wall biosynthesis